MVERQGCGAGRAERVADNVRAIDSESGQRVVDPFRLVRRVGDRDRLRRHSGVPDRVEGVYRAVLQHLGQVLRPHRHTAPTARKQDDRCPRGIRAQPLVDPHRAEGGLDIEGAGRGGHRGERLLVSLGVGVTIGGAAKMADLRGRRKPTDHLEAGEHAHHDDRCPAQPAARSSLRALSHDVTP